MNYNGLVLGGGGTKGFCTLGALQYIFDNKITDIDSLMYFSGTSIGGIISYFIAIGYTPIEIVVYLCSHGVMESLKVNSLSIMLEESGVYDYSIIAEHCRNMTLEKIGYIPTMKELYDKLGKELIVCTYNLTDSKVEYLSYKNYPELSCLDALRMTSNLPFIFGEYFFNECEYLDGGIVNNFPTLPSPPEINKIGIFLESTVNVNTSKGKLELSWTGINKVIDKVYNILNTPLREREKEKLDSLIAEDMTIKIIKIKTDSALNIYKFNLLQHEKLELFSLGYNQTKTFFSV
jgi:predicted patatin/cPLA2 family phospholipase